MKRLTAVLLTGCIVAALAAGCGKKNTGEESRITLLAKESTQTESLTQSEEETESVKETEPEADPFETGTSSEEVPASDQTPSASESVVVNAADYLSLPNDSIPYGYGREDWDALNVPNGVYYYRSLYGQYGADFVQDTSSNVIYLTMDEGYEAGYTPRILDTLKEKNVHAVFFLTKQFVDSSPELVRRMIDEGHILGNHTCSHPSGGMPGIGAEAEIADINKLHDMVMDQFGYDMKLFRFPEGTFSVQSLALVRSLGYQSVFWSFAHADWNTANQPDPTESLNAVLDQIHPGAIYLLHAVSSTNTQILGDFIDGARARGYEFGTYPIP